MLNYNDFDVFVFDFDGTLIDSEPYHKLAHSKVLSLILNKEINLTNKEFERYIGKSDIEIFEMYKKDFDIDFNMEEMINKKVEIARDLLLDEKVKIYSYFFDLIKEKRNKKFYIVSNQHEKILFSVIENKKIKKYFEDIFCLPKLCVKKDFFYKNIKNYIPNMKKVIVFEDDAKVLKFLNDTGYQVVAIQNTINFDSIHNNYENIITVTNK